MMVSPTHTRGQTGTAGTGRRGCVDRWEFLRCVPVFCGKATAALSKWLSSWAGPEPVPLLAERPVEDLRPQHRPPLESHGSRGLASHGSPPAKVAKWADVWS